MEKKKKQDYDKKLDMLETFDRLTYSMTVMFSCERLAFLPFLLLLLLSLGLSFFLSFFFFFLLLLFPPPPLPPPFLLLLVPPSPSFSSFSSLSFDFLLFHLGQAAPESAGPGTRAAHSDGQSHRVDRRRASAPPGRAPPVLGRPRTGLRFRVRVAFLVSSYSFYVTDRGFAQARGSQAAVSDNAKGKRTGRRVSGALRPAAVPKVPQRHEDAVV